MIDTMHQPLAAYERNILTLDLPNAAQPVLWRREISDINQLSFTLAQDNNLHALIYQSAGETDWQTIATFNDRDSATAALQAVRNVLFQPRRAPKYAGGIARPRWVRGPLKWALLAINGLLVLIGMLAIVVVLRALWLQRSQQAAQLPAQTAAAPVAVAPAPAAPDEPAEIPGGRPLPADQYLAPPLNLPEPQPAR